MLTGSRSIRLVQGARCGIGHIRPVIDHEGEWTQVPGVKLIGVGHHQPRRVVTNHELEQLVDTSDEWITRRVGIRERRWAGDDEPLEFLASQAARNALDHAGLVPEEVDLVIVATCTAQTRSPNTATQVAAALGMTNNAPGIDINVVCAGFSYALAMAQQSIQAGAATTALVIGAERLTDVTDFTDRTTCVLTADGAGAVVLTASEQNQISPVLWGSVPQMGPAVRISPADGGKFAQDGRAVFKWTTFELPRIAAEVIERSEHQPSEIAAIVLHQANLRIIEPLASKIGCENAIVATDVVTSGNTSAASIPMALSKLLAENPLPEGAPILLFGFGGGLSYSGQVVGAPAPRD